jgi:hypothetical protein
MTSMATSLMPERSRVGLIVSRYYIEGSLITTGGGGVLMREHEHRCGTLKFFCLTLILTLTLASISVGLLPKITSRPT